MNKKSDEDLFLEYVPLYNTGYKIILIYLYHMMIFSLALFFFWYSTSYIFLASLIVEFALSCGANLPFIYMFNNSDKIRKKYIRKKTKNPWQGFFLKYSYTSPLGCAAFYTPLLLKQNLFFIEPIISLPDNFFTINIFPEYFAITLGFIFIFLGYKIAINSQGFDGDMHSYLHIINSDEKRIIRRNIYKYTRHPRFLCRIISAFGIGIIANNLLAIFVVIIHFIPYLFWMHTMDIEYRRSYGKKIEKYQNQVPALIPYIKNWKKTLELLFSKNS